jgi:hypothetical protein
MLLSSALQLVTRENSISVAAIGMPSVEVTNKETGADADVHCLLPRRCIPASDQTSSCRAGGARNNIHGTRRDR